MNYTSFNFLKKLLIFLVLMQTVSAAAVTYSFSCGRFGDNLIAYLHAKWLSYTYNIPIVYKPFPYSSDLVMDEKELKEIPYQKMVGLGKKEPHIDPETPHLYICPYFPESKWDPTKRFYYSFEMNWKDARFQALAKEMISPKKNLVLTYPPENTLSIALHFREGGGFDALDFTRQNPLKSPPIEYYITCLNKLLDRFPNMPLHCHVFTDAVDPLFWTQKIQNGIEEKGLITFSCREEGNHHTRNVLEDFFSLFNFDILIRPDSNFSIVADMLHNYLAVYSPAIISVNGGEITIEQIEENFSLD